MPENGTATATPDEAAAVVAARAALDDTDARLAAAREEQGHGDREREGLADALAAGGDAKARARLSEAAGLATLRRDIVQTHERRAAEARGTLESAEHALAAAEAADLARRTAEARARVLELADGLDAKLEELAPAARSLAEAAAAFVALAGPGPSWAAHAEVRNPGLLAAAVGRLATWHAAAGPGAEPGARWNDPAPVAVLVGRALAAWDPTPEPREALQAAGEGQEAREAGQDPEAPHGVLVAPSHGLASTSWPSRAPPRPDEVARTAAGKLT